MMKRLTILFLINLTFWITGCGTLVPTKPQVMVWHDWSGEDVKILNSLIADFIAINPDTHVVVRYFPANQLESRYIEQSKLGFGPDLVFGSSFWVHELAENGLIQPVEANRATYASAALKTVTYQGKLYGLPLFMHTDMLYYNRNQVDIPPRTLDQLIVQATDNKTVALPVNFETAFWGIQTFGGQLFDETGRVLLDQGGFANWLGWLKNATTIPNIVWDNDTEALQEMFKNEQVGYFIGNTTLLAELETNMGVEAVGVAPLPEGPNGKAGPFLHTETLFFNSRSSNRQHKAALLLGQFLTNTEQQTKLARQLRRTPANTNVRLNSRVYPTLNSIMVQSKTAVPRPNLPQMDDLEIEGSKAYIEALTGAVNLSDTVTRLMSTLDEAYGVETTTASTTDLACTTSAQGLLLIWHSWQGGSQKALRDLTNQFSGQCPEISISLSYVPQNLLLSEYRTAIKAGRGPALLIGPNHWIAPLADSNAIVDLSYLVEPHVWQQYLPVSQQAMRYQKGIYGFPQSMQVTGLYAKPSQINDPVRFLTDLPDYVTDRNPFAMPIGFEPLFGGITAFNSQRFTQSSDYLTDETAIANWLDWLRTIQQDNGFILSTNYDDLVTSFTQGEAIYLLGNSRSLADIKAQLQDDLMIAPLPAGPEQSVRPFMLVEGIMLNPIIRNDAAQTELALSFAQYLTQTDSQTQFMVGADHVPTNVNVDTSAHPLIESFVAQAEASIPYPNHLQWAEIVKLGNTMYDNVLLHNQSLTQTVTMFTANVQQTLGQSQK